jgi:hypothetical protein
LCARLGLPDDPLEAASAYKGAVASALPAGWIRNELFLYQCVIGEPTRLTRHRERHREGGAMRWVAPLRAGWRLLRRPFRSRLRFVTAATRVKTHVVVATLPLLAAAPAFTVEMSRSRGALVRLRQTWRWLRGRLGDDAAVQQVKVPRFAVLAQRRVVRVTLDGEMRLVPVPAYGRLEVGAVPVLVARGG